MTFGAWAIIFGLGIYSGYLTARLIDAIRELREDDADE